MKVQNIIDFRESSIYKHLKLVHQKDVTDEQLIQKVLKGSDKNILCTLRDSHVFTELVTSDTSTCIHVPFGPYHGIYDIWLRDCNNVATISVVFDNVEIPITEYKRYDNSIQIPLAFIPDSVQGAGVANLFIHRESCICSINRISYIPVIALQYDTMHIRLNAGASCKVHISTVYHEKDYSRMLVCSRNIFYVNGVPLVTMRGTVTKYNDNEGCIIC